MIPPWLVAVLDRELPRYTGAERDRIATAIIDSLPLQPIAQAITTEASRTFERRNIRDAAGDMARHIGNSAAQAVLAAIIEA